MTRIFILNYLLILSLYSISASCEKKAINALDQETLELYFYYNIPGSCPTYFFSSLATDERFIPTESSKTVIESFLKASTNTAKVKVVVKQTKNIIQHYCGDREANPKLHDFIEIEVISIMED